MTQREAQPVPDKRALRTLDLVAEAHQDEVPTEEGRADLTRALGELVDTTDVSAPSDAEAAGIALQLLATEPRFAKPIEAMRSGPTTRSLGPGVVEGTFLIGGLLLALQTHFEFVRDKDGRWSVTIKKKPTSDALLKPLVKKLTDLLGK
jgi:hypothetical protein